MRIGVLASAILLAGCASTGTMPPPATPSRAAVPVPYNAAGLGRVIGQDAAALVKLFGQPDADVREGDARKLQFQSRICVLDAYLYPRGKDEPRVTYVDAREPDGSSIDRASCVAALTRREGNR